jgi:hypothetical protein
MTLLTFILWLPLGALAAYGFLQMQRWSVGRLSPDKPKLSTGLVVGGAFLRWGLFFVLMLLAVRRSIADLLVLLAGFVVTRTLLLFFWQKSLKPFSITTKHVKDKS